MPEGSGEDGSSLAEHAAADLPAGPSEATDAGEHSTARHRLVVELDPMVFVYLGAGVLAAWTLFALYRTAADFVTAIAVGIILAFALDQPVSRLRARFGLPRPLATIGVCSALVLAVTLLVVLLGPPAVQQAARFSQELPDTVEDLYGLPLIGGRFEDAEASERVTGWVDELPSNVSSEAVSDSVDRLAGGLTAAIAVILVAFTVLFDGELIVSRLRRLVPRRHRAQADRFGRIFYRTLGRYFAGSLLLALMTGAYVLTIGLILGVPLAPLAAVWAMVTDLIPQVGGFLGGSVFVMLAVTAGLVTGILALVLFIAYMSTENYLLQPVVVGKAVKLSPPGTMIAALMGGVTAGVPGALVATPLVACAKAVYFELRFGQPAEEESRDRGLPLIEPARRLVARIRAAWGSHA
jgi:putative heme transporter